MPEENESGNVIRLDGEENDLALEVGAPKKEQSKESEERLGFFPRFLQKVRQDKRYLFASIAGVLFLVFGIVILVVSFGGETEEEAQESPSTLEGERKILSSITLDNRPVDVSSLEMMIKKANLLYMQGERGEALNLYENISSFSESLSNFNLGVAQADEKNYERALASFQKAIESGEDRAMSAVNAAMCAFWLNNQPLYHYYVDLAEAYLSDSAALPLYPYLYALVQYYKGHYFEAISPLTHFQNTHYSSEVDHLLSKLHLYYGDNQNALRFLERSAKSEDFLDLALLYARIGEYRNAQTYLIRQIEHGDKTPTPYMALALVDNKLGNLADVAAVLDKYTGEDEQEVASIYPIKTRLKEELFDVHEAQKRFWQDFSTRRLIAYKILFYYAPYKVFDADQALLFIRQGGVNMLLNDIEEAKDVLVKGSTISKVNLNIARALKEVLRNNTRAANELMKAVVQEYPNHAILHYNLGLSYAQMGDFDNAYRHFLRSYHLNSRDILSGIFVMVSAQLTFRDYGRVAESIGSELEHSELEERGFLLSFLGYFQGNQGGALEWLEHSKQPKSIHLALDCVMAMQSKNKERMIEATKRLKEQQPDDLVAALLGFLAQNYGDEVQDLSLKAQYFYREPTTSLNALYYGPALARELYVHVGYNIGALRRVQQLLDDKLVSERGEMRGILQSLALTSIYLREFEKAFVLYNSLIDELKERDSQTLFLASVAAIGAGHHENAIALLQLAKLEAPTNYESRYALALLQQQAKNLKAASIQYAAVGNIGFESEYFDFEVDSSGYLP
ncbi:MAG: tetratricopeptide repeat protein [Wolinella sp.]